MPESDKKIKHFVWSRFFTYQRKTYPYNVLDVDFLSKQLPLAKNMFSSMENQTNQNFELLFLSNPKFFEDPKYEFIFSTLRSFTSLPITFIRGRGDVVKAESNSELLQVLKGALNNYDFVITTSMDFDDFIFKGAVEDTQSKVNECDNVLAYGYNKGYTYIYGELYRRNCTFWKDQGHDSMFRSLILKSSAVKNMPCFCVENFHHNYIKPEMMKFFKDNGIEFTESMFQQNFSTDAFIYFRHDFSQEHLAVKGGKPYNVKGLTKLTTEDITKEQLADEFGFHCELKSIK